MQFTAVQSVVLILTSPLHFCPFIIFSSPLSHSLQAANHTKMLMSRKGGGFPEVVGTLKEMRNMMSSDNLEEMEKRIAEGGEDVSGHGSEDDPETQEKVMILTQLINFCQAL